LQRLATQEMAPKLVAHEPVTSHAVEERPQHSSVTKRFLYIITVLGPALAAGVYLMFFAVDRYEAEARFIVRQPSSATGISSQISSMVQGTSITRSADDAYAVHAYINSHDAARALVDQAALLSRLEKAWSDPLWRYPGMFTTHDEQRLVKYMRHLVSVNYDQTTGISTLKVQAFSAEDARKIADALLRNSELLVNRMSERARRDAIQIAEREVEIARSAAISAQERISAFRYRHSVIDPGKFSQAAQEIIGRLSLEKAQSSALITELKSSAQQSPQIDMLHTRIAALDAQIAKERQSLAGSELSLAPIIAEYDTLSLEREFVERNYSSALAAYELARTDATRQRLFLELISGPNTPDYPAYPYKFLTLLGILFVSWLTASLLSRFLQDTAAHDGH
jgi:capsular polysaccharide transport system permease protein